MNRLAALPDSQRRRLAAPSSQYGQYTTSTVAAPVPQFGAPLPFGRPEASSSASARRELEIDAEARKQELYRRKIEQGKLERAARNNLKAAQDSLKATQDSLKTAQEKWEEEDQRLREVTEAFDEFVINSGSSSMGKRPKPEC